MFWTNFERLCRAIGEPPNTVAANCGASSSGTVTGWKKGATPRPKIVNNLIAYFNRKGISCTVADLFAETEDDDIPSAIPRWLTVFQSKYLSLDDDGKKLVDLVLNAEYDRCTKPVEKPITYIRHYLYSPAAGVNGLASDEYEDIPKPDDAPDGADYCLTVSGDSMEPYIKDKQMIYVSQKAQLHPMDVGVFAYQGGTYVKQYAPSYDGSVYLLSANPKREDANITVTADNASSLVCFGKVLLDKKLPEPIYR